MFPLPFPKDPGFELRQRVYVIMAVVGLVFTFLLGRLWVLQVFDGERYTFLSEKNRIRLKKIPATRGMVFDHKGRLLVDSRPSFDLLFVPEDSDHPEETLSQLAKILGWDPTEVLARYEENRARPAFEEIVLGKDIDWRSVVAVETHQLRLPGVTLRVRPRRSYLLEGRAAHLLGYVGEITRNQLKAQGHQGYTMGDEIGQFGVEKALEPYLRGKNGGQQVEVDALGRRVGVLDEVEDIPGHNVFLTLDRDLQEAAARALEGKEGSVVVLDVHSGAVRALVSAPAFDPNIFARGVSAKEWRALLTDPLKPLNNRAVHGQYPPGSTFKIVVSIAALEEGLLRPEQTIFDPGFFVVGNRAFRDWRPKGHGTVDLHKAIVESCDVYFYQAGQKLGVDTIAKYARLFGLGEKTGIEFEDEKSGLIPDTRWKMKRFRQPWYPGETPSVAIGQGYVTVTPLQMANLMAAVANGGTLFRPWYVHKVESLDGEIVREYRPQTIRSIPLKPSTLEVVRRALRDVVHGPGGTGSASRSALVEIAGKTGTAQVAEMRGNIVKSEHLPYMLRDHAWFVAYAPAEKPEIAVAVLVEHGGHGGSAAAPVAKEVIEKYFSLKAEPQPALKQASVEGQIRAN
ncbi:MAG TPA: penicillin-binding protein 2 [Candidatus Acidoferrales bacterium]|nr:penicillin-binding protein 2 [Candidatus Acidoferrales bacterium]